jgi:hypothetical protein
MSSEPTTYFGGRTAFDGKVHRLLATDFKQFVTSQIYVPVQIDMDRRSFLAHPDRDKIKDGAFITSAVYAAEETRRNNANVKAFNLVIIDLDGGSAAKDFTESPSSLAEALSPLNFVAWTTAKHTPEEPRLKIAVDCAESDPVLHGRAVAYVSKLLGLPSDFKGVTESNVLSQLHYRPVVFKGDEFDAIISSNLTGSQLDPSTLEETLPEGATAGEYAYQLKGDEVGASDILSLPLQDITVEEALEALNLLDPDADYFVWTQTGMALRHQFTEEDDAREAFEGWDEWSSQGSKYRGREETLLKWHSFKPYPDGRSPVTIRTVFKLAIDNGWNPGKFNERHLGTFAEFCDSASPTELLSEGIKRIASMPIRSAVNEEMMTDTLIASLKGHGNKVTRAAILADVKRWRQTERANEAKATIPSWMSPYCFIGPQDKFRNNITGQEYSVDAFNHTYSRYLINEATEASLDGKAPMTPTNYALNIMKIEIVEGVIYDPRERHDGEPYFTRDGRKYVNAFLSSSVPKPSPVGAKRAGNLIKKLLRANLANEDYERVVLDWMAYSVQFPGEKIRWAIFIQGGQGCGKGTLVDTLRAALGDANVKVVTGSSLTGQFNDYREGAMLVYVDELFSSGANRHEVNNKLKDGVTNTYVSVDKKFKDLVMIPNVSNYILTSNKHDALVLEDSDRRYYILKSRLQSRRQIEAFKATGVMERIHALIEENRGAFRHFFLNHEISEDFNPNGHAPETRFRNELVEAGKNSLLMQIEDLIDDPAHPLIGSDVIHYAQLERDTAILGKNNARPAHYLHVLGYYAYQDGQIFEVNGERTRIYIHCDNFVEGVDDALEILEERTPDL